MKRTYAEHPDYDASAPLLAVKDLRVRFETHQGSVRAVNGIGYTLSPGETFGILGESGSGKSVSQEAVIGIVGARRDTCPGAFAFAASNSLTRRKPCVDPFVARGSR